MPVELLPCPFCGKAARVEEHIVGDSIVPYYMPGCEDHRLDYCGDTMDEAITEWNQRAESKEQNSDSPALPVQQLKAEIRALHDEFRELYDGDFSGEAVSLLLTKMLDLSAV